MQRLYRGTATEPRASRRHRWIHAYDKPQFPHPVTAPADDDSDDAGGPACVVFNASDPSGAGGLSADVSAIASVGAHALPVVTGAYARDTAEIFEHFSFDEEAVAEQARTILEDVPVQVIKVGFAGNPEALSAPLQRSPPTTPTCR
jgi:hydroxymethylpyrimidine/phosphomethylpyrimidine kinase